VEVDVVVLRRCQMRRCLVGGGVAVCAEGASSHVVAEPGGYAPRALRLPVSAAPCCRVCRACPCSWVRLVIDGAGQPRLQCPVADLLADQRGQTRVRPRVSQIQVRWGHGPLSLRARRLPRIVAYGRPAQPDLEDEGARKSSCEVEEEALVPAVRPGLPGPRRRTRSRAATAAASGTGRSAATPMCTVPWAPATPHCLVRGPRSPARWRTPGTRHSRPRRSRIARPARGWRRTGTRPAPTREPRRC
jgi:hypothetical protein